MISKTYLKLVRYFSGLIVITCLLSMVLFFLTMGAPMARDFHRLLRNQAQYIGQLTGELVNKDALPTQIHQFLEMTSGYYDIGCRLVTTDMAVVASVKDPFDIDVAITGDMIETIKTSGIFVQPSHGGKPMIYGLLIASEKHGDHYLFIYKKVSRLKRTLIFGLGLLGLCGLLIWAIYPLSKSFTRPLTQLTRAQEQMVAGNFDSTLDGMDREDEFGTLLRGFVNMQHSVDEMIASRKALLADISHELRSPLSRLNIDTQLIQESGSLSEVRDHARNIEYEIQYMDTLLKQLTQYSTLNLPEVKLNRELFDLTGFLETVGQSFQSSFEQKQISFEIKKTDSVLMVSADRAKLTQVLNNLFDNAIGACSPGGMIRVDYRDLNDRVELTVSNTGSPIPEEFRRKIFDPMFRADPSRNRKTGGFGLGLAISKKIVELHGGQISCDWQDGETGFVFTLEKTG